MRIAAGSGNPVKRRAVEHVLDCGEGCEYVREEGRNGDREGCLDRPTVEAVPVRSGVSERPRGLGETIAGAENGAFAVLERGDYDIGVGIEGGVARVDAANGLFLVM